MNLRITPPRRPQGTKMPKRLNVAKLRNELTKASLEEELEMKLPPPNTDPQADVEAEWARLCDAVYTAANDVVGPVTRKNQDWFDENNSSIQTRLEEKRRLHRALLNDPSSVSKKDAYDAMKKTVRTDLRQMQDEWFRKQAADSKDMKNFYSALKAVYGPTSSGSAPLLSADGTTLISDKKKLLERWAEHFDTVLNRPSTCLLYTSPSPRDQRGSRMPSSA